MKQLNTFNIILLCIFTTTTFSNNNSLLNELLDTTTTQPSTDLSNLILHFYYLRRLTKAVCFLSLLGKQYYQYRPCNIITKKNHILIDSTYFTHYAIQHCIKKMLKSVSLKPLLLLLHHAKHYRYIRDKKFTHELFLLIFIVYKQILFHECEENRYSLKTISLNDVMLISEKINQLPISEVLNAIDMLLTELPPFLEKYEFNEKIPWKTWLKKYWWVPPIVGGWFGLKILLRLQKHNFYFSSYGRQMINLPPIFTNDPALLEIRNTPKNISPMNDQVRTDGNFPSIPHTWVVVKHPQYPDMILLKS